MRTMLVIGCMLLAQEGAVLAQNVFQLGPGGRTVAGPGHENPICRNSLRPLGQAFEVMETTEGGRMLCVTVANEGSCTLRFAFSRVSSRDSNCEWNNTSSCLFGVNHVPAHAVRALCERTGGRGMTLQVEVACPDLAPDALGPCPFSWRVDAVG